MSASDANSAAAPQAILLAAGQGKRMGGDLPKVLYEVADRPMIHWVLDACEQAGVARCIVVIGYRGDEVRESLIGREGVVFVEQREQLGTGHAAQQAQPLLEDQPDVDVFVLAGDGPLIRAATLATLRDRHAETSAAASLATSRIDDPTGYGRIVRDSAGAFLGIVEQKNATPDQLAIDEVNPSYYCFDVGKLFAALDAVEKNPVTGEYYITDVPAILMQQGERVEVIDAVPAEDVLSINTPEQLAEVDRILRDRIAGGAGSAVAGGDA